MKNTKSGLEEQKKKNPFIKKVKWLIISFLSIIYCQIFAQTISISMKNVSLHEILMEIKKESGKNIVYNNNLIEKYNNESVTLKKVSFEEALNKVLEGKRLKYKFVDEVIIIEGIVDTQSPDNTKVLKQTITGSVYDAESSGYLSAWKGYPFR